MITQAEFFTKYKINKEKFDACKLKWEDLIEIDNAYVKCYSDLESTAKYIVDCLRQVKAVHSLKFRIKDPEHLIEKIIRKKFSDPSLEINIENYRTRITDLIGVRILHLFKEDWGQIHHFIKSRWNLFEKPTANIRSGDSTNKFTEEDCEIKEQEYGYRSVHYLVKSELIKETHIAELQVRTIFEEGWSEIDHRIRYPYEMDNPLLNQYLFIFNRLSGSADEMGSFVKLLKNELGEVAKKKQVALEEKDKAINQLREQIKKLKIETKERDKLEDQIEALSNVSSQSTVLNLIPPASILNSTNPILNLTPPTSILNSTNPILNLTPPASILNSTNPILNLSTIGVAKGPRIVASLPTAVKQSPKKAKKKVKHVKAKLSKTKPKKQTGKSIT